MAELVVSWCLDGTLMQSLEVSQGILSRVQRTAVEDEAISRQLRHLQIPYKENLFEIEEEVIKVMCTLREKRVKQALVTKRSEPIPLASGDTLEAPKIFEPYVNIKVEPSGSAISVIDAAPYDRAMKALGGTPERYVIIGDHPVDILIAKSIGAFGIGLNLQDMPARSEEFRRAQADAVAETPDEVLAPILQHFSMEDSEH